MSAQPAACPKCQSPMEPGIVLDRGHFDRPVTQEWLEGQPEVSIWTGIKTKGREKFPVRTNRCTKCGYLESFSGPA